MKKIIALILALALIMAFAACGKVEITIQDIVDANQTEALLKNHQSVYIQVEMDGEVWNEIYVTKDYFYNYIPDEVSDWVEFMTDDVCYYNLYGDCLLYVSITPDGVSDYASIRAERNKSYSLTTETAEHTIESVSKKDGRITVKTNLNQDILAAEENEFGMTSAKSEYVLDAKTLEFISVTSDYTYDDGKAVHMVTKVAYDVDAPEKAQTIWAYENQTENLRNITIVSNPGTEKEVSQSIEAPKGLMIGFEFDDELASATEFYTDAACTEAYDPYADADSDLTIYVKWIE